jgi:hypothetical protein
MNASQLTLIKDAKRLLEDCSCFRGPQGETGATGISQVLIAVNISYITHTFEDTGEHIIQELNINNALYLFPAGLPRGWFSITANFAVYNPGFNDKYDIIIREGTSGLEVKVNLELADIPYSNTSGSLSFGYKYTPGDGIPVFQQIIKSLYGTIYNVKPTWNIVFYPVAQEFDPVIFPT